MLKHNCLYAMTTNRISVSECPKRQQWAVTGLIHTRICMCSPQENHPLLCHMTARVNNGPLIHIHPSRRGILDRPHADECSVSVCVLFHGVMERGLLSAKAAVVSIQRQTSTDSLWPHSSAPWGLLGSAPQLSLSPHTNPFSLTVHLFISVHYLPL